MSVHRRRNFFPNHVELLCAHFGNVGEKKFLNQMKIVTEEFDEEKAI